MANDSVFGRSLQEARRVVSAKLTSFPVNSTSTLYVLALPTARGSVRVTKVSWVGSAVLSDADGTMLVSVIARDVSEAADDTLVNAASVEGGTAHAVADFTLATETSEKEFTLDAGDSLRVTFTNNSAAIDTNGAISVFVEYHLIPNYDEKDAVQHPSKYR
jgi:hypothetical protein